GTGVTGPDAPRDAGGDQASLAFSDRLVLFLATGLGVGHVPVAPGTFGSLWGLPLAWAVDGLPAWGHAIAAAGWFSAGVPVCSVGARLLHSKDPGAVVFDEIAAFSVVFLGTTMNLATAVVGFVLFRIFDVWKPWPARRLEALPGGLGIMADDYVAALYAA